MSRRLLMKSTVSLEFESTCNFLCTSIIIELSEEVTKLLTDEKLSQQQGRTIPFGEEQGWRFQLPQEQNWQSPSVPYALKQDTDEVNSKFGI